MVFTIQAEGSESFNFNLEQDDVIYLLEYAKKHAIDGEKCSLEKNGDGRIAEENSEVPQPKKYKGFLLIKCDTCGEVKGFCAREAMDSYYCKNCGQKTPLKDLRVLYEDCECGMHYKYMTNQTDDFVTHECISCGAQNTMVLNSRRTTYVTRKQRNETADNTRYVWKYENKRKQAI